MLTLAVRRLHLSPFLLRFTSLPSTSTKTFFLSESRCHASFAVATETKAIEILRRWPELQRYSAVVWVRGGRGPTKDGVKTNGQSLSSSSSSKPEREQLTPFQSFLLKLLIFTTVMTLINLKIEKKKKDEVEKIYSSVPPDAPVVDFAQFVQKYLTAGEVTKIIFLAGKNKAVATLQPEAIIDGEPAIASIIMFYYTHHLHQLRDDIRKEEAQLGIALKDGVDIQLLNVENYLKLRESIVPLMILAWSSFFAIKMMTKAMLTLGVRRLCFSPFRLRLPSLPSTSTTFFSLESRCHASFAVATEAKAVDILRLLPELQRYSAVVWVRGGRGPTKNGEETSEQASSSSSSSEDEAKQEPLKPMPPPPNKVKMFVVAAVLSMAVTSLLFSTLMAENKITDSSIPPDAPVVDFAHFVHNYLNAGEVSKIVFLVGKNKAIATLQPGAIIDGKPADTPVVVIDYTQPPREFWADIRKEEAELGIALKDGVNIELLNPVSGLKLFEFMLGMFILGWLFTMYGRLLRKKVLEERARRAGRQ